MPRGEVIPRKCQPSEREGDKNENQIFCQSGSGGMCRSCDYSCRNAARKRSEWSASCRETQDSERDLPGQPRFSKKQSSWSTLLTSLRFVIRQAALHRVWCFQSL